MMLSNKKNNFLIVDDHPAIRHVIKSNLLEMGFDNVIEAYDGADALLKVRDNSIDFIVSDWSMPTLSGLELLEKLRRHPKYQKIPFMMVTAETDRESVKIAVAAGVDQFLIKPFSLAMFRTKINQLVLHGKHARHVTLRHGREPEIAKNKTRPARSKKKTILVVDDIPINIDVLSGILSGEYRVLAATNGIKALKLAKGDLAVDLILLDIMMPGMDGMEVCRRLKADPVTADIPIIFLTAKTEADDIAAALDAGGVDYVTKPFHPTVLKARVRTHLSLKTARDDIREQMDTLVENARLREDVECMARHDLKSPVAAIISLSESLLEGILLDIEQKNSIKNIGESAYDILGMIDRSLDLYKMEMGQYKFKKESIDVNAVVLKVVNAARENAKQYGVTIQLSAADKYFVHGEALLIFSMLGNLLKNAVEASSNEGKVTVRISCDEQVTISIHNQNMVPEEIHNCFFDKFVTSGKKKGSGLGTYSAKLMAKVQGGDISFKSTPANGTRLTVRLPKGNAL